MASTSDSPGILYACVAHATTILSEHTAPSTSTTNTTSASSLASIILPKVNHATPQKLTYTHDRLFVHLISDSPSGSSNSNNTSEDTTEPTSNTSLVYLCVAQSSLGRRIPFAFLLSLKTQFLQSFPTSSTNFSSLPAYGAASFNPQLKSLITTYNTSPPSDALATARREIDTVKDIMTQNIEQVLQRGERIDLLVDKTDRLGGSARDFRVRSKGLRRMMWWKNVRIMVLLIVVGVFLIYLFVGFGCGLPAWGRCVGH